MTTTPVFWSNEITVSFDINAFAPQVAALSDNTFIIGWQDGTNIFARHLNESGSFTSGNFLSALSDANPKPLINPSIFQQVDGRVVVTYGELDGTNDYDIHWHSPNPPGYVPHASSFPIENSAFSERLLDSAPRTSGGGAVVYQFEGPGGATHSVLRFIDAVGNQASNQIFIGPHAGEVQQNPAITGLHTGFIAAAYENFNSTTFARDVRMHVYTPAGTDVSGEVIVSSPGTGAAFPDVIELLDGTFVVTWQQNNGIGFRRYFGNGLPLDATPLVVQNSAGGLLPKITALNDGGFIVAWTAISGTESDGSPDLDIVMQRFAQSGTTIGSQLAIDKPGDQGLFGMSITTLDDGRVILTYVSETGDSTNITTLNYRIVDPREQVINGTNGADNVVGGTTASIISGFDGNDNLTGEAGNDTISGGFGDDALFGGVGNDRLLGDDGNDRLLGEAGNDALNGGLGNDAIFGGSGNDTLAGSSGNDHLFGELGRDRVVAGSGNDTVNGGYGNDVLYGQSGRDVFEFDARLGTSRTDRTVNFDRVVDFNVRDDAFWLDNAVFRKLGSRGSEDHPVKLNKVYFEVGERADDRNDYLLYNSKTGVLSYDADGSGRGRAVEFAQLAKNLKLTYHDFFVV